MYNIIIKSLAVHNNIAMRPVLVSMLTCFCYLCLQFDNIMMEEAAQILEIETFIPLLLQVGGLVVVHFVSTWFI